MQAISLGRMHGAATWELLKLNGHEQIGEENQNLQYYQISKFLICFPWYPLAKTQKQSETWNLAPSVERKSSKRSPLVLFQGTRKRTPWVRGSGGFFLHFPFSPTQPSGNAARWCLAAAGSGLASFSPDQGTLVPSMWGKTPMLFSLHLPVT